jgi:hypothetical protein
MVVSEWTARESTRVTPSSQPAVDVGGRRSGRTTAGARSEERRHEQQDPHPHRLDDKHDLPSRLESHPPDPSSPARLRLARTKRGNDEQDYARDSEAISPPGPRIDPRGGEESTPLSPLPVGWIPQ